MVILYGYVCLSEGIEYVGTMLSGLSEAPQKFGLRALLTLRCSDKYAETTCTSQRQISRKPYLYMDTGPQHLGETQMLMEVYDAALASFVIILL